MIKSRVPFRWLHGSMAVLTVAAMGSAAAWAAPEIAGGTRVYSGHPIARSTVMLQSETPAGTSLCSASILASDIILTAAHCVTDASDVKIIFGISAKEAVHVASAQKVLVPELYTQKGVFDIALIRFSGGLPKSYRAAELLPSPRLLKANTPIIVAGFGITNMKTHEGAGILRMVGEKIHPKNKPGVEVVFNHAVNTSVCPGDSGGPAFLRVGTSYQLFGVASRIAVSDGPCGSLSIYTDIHDVRVMGYIKDAIKLLRKD